jgi:hypothetical protein
MTTLYQRSWPQMNETPDSLLATDEPPPFTPKVSWSATVLGD